MEEWAETVIADPCRTLQSESERFLLDHFRPLEVDEGALDDEIVVEVLEGEREVRLGDGTDFAARMGM
jgi:hypothetical protein